MMIMLPCSKQFRQMIFTNGWAFKLVFINLGYKLDEELCAQQSKVFNLLQLHPCTMHHFEMLLEMH